MLIKSLQIFHSLLLKSSSELEKNRLDSVRGSIGIEGSDREIFAKVRTRTRSITPWSVTGVSYATFCCLASLSPALVLFCLERAIDYDFLPWWRFSLPKDEGESSTNRSICLSFREQGKNRRKSGETEEEKLLLNLSIETHRRLSPLCEVQMSNFAHVFLFSFSFPLSLSLEKKHSLYLFLITRVGISNATIKEKTLKHSQHSSNRAIIDNEIERWIRESTHEYRPTDPRIGLAVFIRFYVPSK